MATAQAERSIDEVTGVVSDDLSKANLALSPKKIAARPFVDGLGEDAWEVLLILPKPQGETWDRTAVFDARMAAVAAFDRLVDGTTLELPGRTLAMVTTDEAAEEDVAPEDDPEEGEDPAADLPDDE